MRLGRREPLPDLHDRWITCIRSNRETELSAHLQHRAVLTQNLPDELTYTKLSGDFDKPDHQQVSDSPPFPIAANSDRILGAHSVRIGKVMRNTECRAIEFTQ